MLSLYHCTLGATVQTSLKLITGLARTLNSQGDHPMAVCLLPCQVSNQFIVRILVRAISVFRFHDLSFLEKDEGRRGLRRSRSRIHVVTEGFLWHHLGFDSVGVAPNTNDSNSEPCKQHIIVVIDRSNLLLFIIIIHLADVLFVENRWSEYLSSPLPSLTAGNAKGISPGVQVIVVCTGSGIGGMARSQRNRSHV